MRALGQMPVLVVDDEPVVRTERCVATHAFIITRVRARVPSQVGHLKGPLYFLSERALMADSYPVNDVFQIRLALDEALTNALRHGLFLIRCAVMQDLARLREEGGSAKCSPSRTWVSAAAPSALPETSRRRGRACLRR